MGNAGAVAGWIAGSSPAMTMWVRTDKRSIWKMLIDLH